MLCWKRGWPSPSGNTKHFPGTGNGLRALLEQPCDLSVRHGAQQGHPCQLRTVLSPAHFWHPAPTNGDTQLLCDFGVQLGAEQRKTVRRPVGRPRWPLKRRDATLVARCGDSRADTPAASPVADRTLSEAVHALHSNTSCRVRGVFREPAASI